MTQKPTVTFQRAIHYAWYQLRFQKIYLNYQDIESVALVGKSGVAFNWAQIFPQTKNLETQISSWCKSNCPAWYQTLEKY